jgi:integrating conjugative element protein (TIGR03758 family)
VVCGDFVGAMFIAALFLNRFKAILVVSLLFFIKMAFAEDVNNTIPQNTAVNNTAELNAQTWGLTSAAGVSPDKISFFIRTILLALTFVWAAWCVYGEIHQLRHGDTDIEKMTTKIMRILFVVTIVTTLVFI